MRAMTMALAIALVAACGGSGSPASVPTGPAQELPAALEQMQLTFMGSPARSQIQAKVDESFGLYGLRPSEDTYSRAGSTLVALRREMNEQGCGVCTEMAILDYMIESHVPGVDMEWHEAAGWAAASLAAEQ